MKQFVVALALVALPSVVAAQTPPVKNPTAITFTSADHDNAAVTGYEVDVVNNTTSAVIQTLTVAKSATTKLPTGEIRVTLNVQPITFGTYRFVARTIAGALSSSNSVPSDTWERSPGQPSKPFVQ